MTKVETLKNKIIKTQANLISLQQELLAEFSTDMKTSFSTNKQGKGISVTIIEDATNERRTFDTIKNAALFLKVPKTTLRDALNSRHYYSIYGRTAYFTKDLEVSSHNVSSIKNIKRKLP